MGGVNDIREGAKAETVINNLIAIREKCIANDITPVFVTITSMNPKIIKAYLTKGIKWIKLEEISNNSKYILYKGD